MLKMMNMYEARKSLKLTARKFCEELGMPWATYYNIESGKRSGRYSDKLQIREFFKRKLNIEVLFPKPVCDDFTLKGLRKANGWTQAEVAEKIGASVVAYSAWERGEHKPNLIYYLKLVELYRYELSLNIDGNYTVKGLSWRPVDGVPEGAETRVGSKQMFYIEDDVYDSDTIWYEDVVY